MCRGWGRIESRVAKQQACGLILLSDPLRMTSDLLQWWCCCAGSLDLKEGWVMKVWGTTGAAVFLSACMTVGPVALRSANAPDGYSRNLMPHSQGFRYSVDGGPVRAGYPGSNFRRGIYGSSTKRWDRVQPNTFKPTLVAFYDAFRVGRSRKYVDTHVVERQSGAAVD